MSRSDIDDPAYISLIGTKGQVRERRLDNEADNFEKSRYMDMNFFTQNQFTTRYANKDFHSLLFQARKTAFV